MDHNQPKHFDEDERLFEPKDVLRYLPGIVTKTEISVQRGHNRSFWNDDDTVEVRFSHFSIQEFLMLSRIRLGPASFYSISKNDAELHLAILVSLITCNSAKAKLPPMKVSKTLPCGNTVL